MRVANPSCVVTSKAASLGGWLSRLLETVLNQNAPSSRCLGSQAEDAIRTNVAREDARIAQGLLASDPQW